MAETDKDDLISIIEEDEKDATLPETLPLMTVRDIVIFNDMLLPLFVGREKSVRAVEEAVAKNGYLFLATQKDPGIENPEQDQIFSVATQRNTDEFTFHGAGNSLTQGSLSHTRWAHKTENWTFHPWIKLPYAQIFQHAILYFVQRKMVLVEDLFGALDIEYIFGRFTPGQINQPVQIGSHN